MTLTVREARVQLARPTIEKGMHISALLKVLKLRLQETVLCNATHGSMNHKKVSICLQLIGKLFDHLKTVSLPHPVSWSIGI